MIIIGYPGIGKSTLADHYDPSVYEDRTGVFPKSVIDLESSAFTVLNDELGFVDINGRPCRSNNWAEVYCKVAEELSDQGHLVFVSSHREVQKLLRECIGPVGVICPSLELKKEWIKRLRNRYKCSADSEKGKNLAAYKRACDHYEDDIAELESNGFEFIEITSLHYKLEDLIFGESKEG